MSFWASMFYWEEKLMKTLALLLLVVSCGHMSEGAYKKKYFIKEVASKATPQEVHTLLLEKMTKCYPQKGYPVFEKTLGKYNADSESGFVSYEIDNQSVGPVRLVLVEILKADTGSTVKIYSKGDLFRPAGVYEHNVQKWVDGQTVDCHSHGKI